MSYSITVHWFCIHHNFRYKRLCTANRIINPDYVVCLRNKKPHTHQCQKKSASKFQVLPPGGLYPYTMYVQCMIDMHMEKYRGFPPLPPP